MSRPRIAPGLMSLAFVMTYLLAAHEPPATAMPSAIAPSTMNVRFMRF
jgi:hypothetical protein